MFESLPKIWNDAKDYADKKIGSALGLVDIELEKKIDKTEESDKVYGTDNQGNQIIIDKNSLGSTSYKWVSGSQLKPGDEIYGINLLNTNSWGEFYFEEMNVFLAGVNYYIYNPTIQNYSDTDPLEGETDITLTFISLNDWGSPDINNSIKFKVIDKTNGNTVWVGSTPPSDDGYTVWINPEENDQYLVDLGVKGATVDDNPVEKDYDGILHFEDLNAKTLDGNNVNSFYKTTDKVANAVLADTATNATKLDGNLPSAFYKKTDTVANATLAATATIANGLAQSVINSLHSDILKKAYPIGSYFISNVSTVPSTVLGFGTWVQVANGRHLVATTGTPGDGGSASLNIAITNMPQHNHPEYEHNHAMYWNNPNVGGTTTIPAGTHAFGNSCPIDWVSSNTANRTMFSKSISTTAVNQYSGNNTPLTNSPLNRSAYIWYRTA